MSNMWFYVHFQEIPVVANWDYLCRQCWWYELEIIIELRIIIEFYGKQKEYPPNMGLTGTPLRRKNMLLMLLFVIVVPFTILFLVIGPGESFQFPCAIFLEEVINSDCKYTGWFMLDSGLWENTQRRNSITLSNYPAIKTVWPLCRIAPIPFFVVPSSYL